jgi:hypothetical protein
LFEKIINIINTLKTKVNNCTKKKSNKNLLELLLKFQPSFCVATELELPEVDMFSEEIGFGCNIEQNFSMTVTAKRPAAVQLWYEGGKLLPSVLLL